MRRTIPVLALLAIASLLFVRLNPPETRYPRPNPVSPDLASALARLRARIGSIAPELTFRFVSDDSVHRLSEFRGRVVLLDVWVTGCGPCWAEMPALTTLQSLHGTDRLAVIALAPQPRDRVQVAAEKRGIKLPPLCSYTNRMSWVHGATLPKTLPLAIFIDGWIPNMAWPLTILIDTTGRIREVRLGRQSEEQLRANLRAFI